MGWSIKNQVGPMTSATCTKTFRYLIVNHKEFCACPTSVSVGNKDAKL